MANFRITNTRVNGCAINNGSGQLIDINRSSFSLRPDRWYQVDVCRSSGYFTIFIDRQLVYQYAVNSIVNNSGPFRLRIGTNQDNSAPYSGYISSIRIFRGWWPCNDDGSYAGTQPILMTGIRDRDQYIQHNTFALDFYNGRMEEVIQGLTPTTVRGVRLVNNPSILT